MLPPWCTVEKMVRGNPRLALCAALCMLGIFCLPPSLRSQQTGDSLLDAESLHQKYQIELTGEVLGEKFRGVTMSVQFSGSDLGSRHHYQLIFAGFPDEQTRNGFYWDSEKSAMEVSANRVTCAIEPGQESDMHFFYMSPALLKKAPAQKNSRDASKAALKTARPTKVFAQAGELTLAVNPRSITGSVWLHGYDKVQKSHVRYFAQFTGRPAARIEQKIKRK